jgi:choline dehydrogenase-like flavoprotein
MNEMGWSWWPAPNAITQKPMHGLVPCGRLGTCENGCQNGSKAQADITHWPYALRNGATLITGARVREITLDSGGRADGATFLDTDGREHHIRAEVVIMAANGIGTPRILQLSTSARFPDGLANSSGLLGRNLMLHPTAMGVAVYDEPLTTFRGPAGQNVHSYEFYETDESRGFVRGAKWVTMPSGGPLITSLLIPAEDGHPPTGQTLLDGVRRMTGHTLLVPIISEDLPSTDNRVELDDVLTDSSGLPAPRITYRRDQNNIDLINFHLARCGEALEASGAREVMLLPVMEDQPGHLLGTARMSTDPSSSVVDPWCRTHDVPNLYIIDGSVFVTSGGVNPTNTIAAIALRAVTGLVERAAEQVTP